MKDDRKKPDIGYGFLIALLLAVTMFNICIFSYIGCEMIPWLMAGGFDAVAEQPVTQPTQQPQQTPAFEQADSGAKTDNPIPEPSGEPTQPNSAPSGSDVQIVSENLHIYTNSLGSKVALYLCEIKNYGNSPVRATNISVDVKDTSGNILTSRNYISAHPDVIAPGASAYICEEVISMTDTHVDASLAKNAVLHYSEEPRSLNTISAEITQATFGLRSTYPNVTGSIKNTGSETISNVYISVPVFSVSGQLQTNIFTIVDELAPGQEKGFEQMAINCDTSLDYSSSYLGEISIYTPVYF